MIEDNRKGRLRTIEDKIITKHYNFNTGDYILRNNRNRKACNNGQVAFVL